jgi:poly(3-hydroxybutyrate) depolymerase
MRTAFHKWHPWCWLLLAILAVLILVATLAWRYACNKAPRSLKVFPEQMLEVNGKPRQYRLAVPESLDNLKSVPVVFVFHGSGETPEQMARNTRLDRLAAEENCIVVYPQGKRLSWPVVDPEDNPDCLDTELMFFDDLLRNLAAEYPVDLKRVYALGMSQGGAFVSLLAAHRSDCLAAVASHSSWLPESLIKHGIQAQRKLPVIFIAGTEDEIVPQSQTRQAYEHFKTEGHPAEFYLLSGVGHHWALPQDVDLKIWRFLSVHARP